MKKHPTGEPYAGEPHVRFGGRGRGCSSLPLSSVGKLLWFAPTLVVEARRFACLELVSGAALDYEDCVLRSPVDCSKAGVLRA